MSLLALYHQTQAEVICSTSARVSSGPRHVPHAQHTLIEGAGHMMPLTHPEPLTRALVTGIERLLTA
jgi:pimeloyl-ACP methyl ester carboxylesterase